jgi:hypothetical protein
MKIIIRLSPWGFLLRKDLSAFAFLFRAIHNFSSVNLIFHAFKILLLKNKLLFLSTFSEGIRAISIWLVNHKPVVLLFDLLLTIVSPSRNPVISNWVKYHSRALLAGWHTSFKSKLFPFSHWFLLGNGLLSRSNDTRSWQCYTEHRLCIFEDFAIVSLSCNLGSF